MALNDLSPPAVMVEPSDEAPTPVIDTKQLVTLGQNLKSRFERYARDRVEAEQKWMRNLRQYLGVYDPDIDKAIPKGRSRAYPRITRVKCISVLSRIMNLMFPGNEKNWALTASPSPDMSEEDIREAVERQIAKLQEQGMDLDLTNVVVEEAVNALAVDRAQALEKEIDDQLQEIGGDQTKDYIGLNRKVVKSGIMYGLGVLTGPLVRTIVKPAWGMDEEGLPAYQPQTFYKPLFEFLPVWDFYPDMGAKDFEGMDGYFIRKVLTRSQLRALRKRPDFFANVITSYLSRDTGGNYKSQPYEDELRSMGTQANVSNENPETDKYEVAIWHGPVSAKTLQQAGVQVETDKLGEDVEAEIWLVDGHVIKADINAWRKLGIEVKTLHTFLFDEDDTSIVGNGLPNVVRDSQMAVAAASRMLLDNASVVCGPNLEINTDLIRMDQDITAVEAWKLWYREGTGIEAQFPAVRAIQIDSHIVELTGIIELFMNFADAETFVGPATGGDMEHKGMGEPMRTAAGASMLRGDAALPFKDIVRNFDSFTQSVIYALVQFNKKFNPDKALEGDYAVIARGASSLIAKEVRGMQVDQMAATLTDGERIHVDERKLVETRFGVRDMSDMLVSADEAKRRQKAMDARAEQVEQTQQELSAAEIRKTLADAFKNISQAQKNSANADATAINAALEILNQPIEAAKAEKDLMAPLPQQGGTKK